MKYTLSIEAGAMRKRRMELEYLKNSLQCRIDNNIYPNMAHMVHIFRLAEEYLR
jgi:hypothetical protein